MDLNEDTLAFLRQRAEFRLALRDALVRTEDDDDEDDGEDPGPGGAVVTVNGAEDACDVPGREEEEEDGCTELLKLLNDLTPIETFRDPAGWPNSDRLYDAVSEFVEKTASRETTRAEHTAENFGLLQRQVTVLESYRKMLLHKKQNSCHFLLSWCEVMKKEPQLLNELVAAIKGQPVGRFYDPDQELVDDYTEGDA